ncbi:MAG: DUF362 domain-containing protein [Proteobacteria bacterium]|nr:DUF362 domain-containing protein [Pseudomonadota bacterium]MBU1902613.1 DUF362 domain-containing protein [Pseudomonadota bacterium]
MDQPITRREAIRKGLIISGSVLLAGTLGRPDLKSPVALAEQKKGGFVVEGVGKAEGYSVAELTKRVFDAAGGMQQFVSKGDVVVVKPNISWARAPNLAATTNPEVLEAVIKLAFNAGAKKVRIVDNTIHDARRCFALSGAGMVAKKTGADLIYPRSSLMRDMKIQGHRLDVWPVFTPVIEADKVINIPVAKVHTLSKLTLGMKNWIGGVGGRRNALHQDIHQTIVDLAQFFKPSVTLIDAIRVMVKNGPSGGSESDVAVMNRLILSNDPVAADAKGAGLFQIPPQSIGFILLAEKRGLGTSDLTKLNQQQVIL